MKKRFVGLLCALGIMAAVVMPASAATFSDVDTDHWAYENITLIAEIGMVNGYPNGTFQPSGTITSAEVASVIYKGFYNSMPGPEVAEFADVPASHWAYEALATAGWAMISYYDPSDPDTYYIYPDQPTCREDVAYTVGFIAYWWITDSDYPPAITPTDFLDADEISEACEPYFSFAVSAGLINGYADGNFHPEATITRAEFATLIVRLLDYLSNNASG